MLIYIPTTNNFFVFANVLHCIPVSMPGTRDKFVLLVHCYHQFTTKLSQSMNTFSRKYRPLVKEMDVWPKLHIDSRTCPFDQETQANDKPSKTNRKRNETTLKGKLKQPGQ